MNNSRKVQLQLFELAVAILDRLHQWQEIPVQFSAAQCAPKPERRGQTRETQRSLQPAHEARIETWLGLLVHSFSIGRNPSSAAGQTQ